MSHFSEWSIKNRLAAVLMENPTERTRASDQVESIGKLAIADVGIDIHCKNGTAPKPSTGHEWAGQLETSVLTYPGMNQKGRSYAAYTAGRR
jgi:hypothetical protein